MANTKTKIPAGLQVFTDSITTEQLKQVEEAIKEQNAAIDNLFQKLDAAISSINKQKPQSPEGLSKAELKTTVDQYVSDFTGKFAEIMKNYLASFRGEVTTLRKERQANHQELQKPACPPAQGLHPHRHCHSRGNPPHSFFIWLPSLPQQLCLLGQPGV